MSSNLWGKQPPKSRFYRVMLTQNRGCTGVLNQEQFEKLDSWIKEGRPFLFEQQTDQEGVYLVINPRSGGFLMQVAMCLIDREGTPFVGEGQPVSQAPRPTLTPIQLESEILASWDRGIKTFAPAILEKLEALDTGIKMFLTPPPPPTQS